MEDEKLGTHTSYKKNHKGHHRWPIICDTGSYWQQWVRLTLDVIWRGGEYNNHLEGKIRVKEICRSNTEV